MVWILFMWVAAGNPTLSTQEFNSRKDCVRVAKSLQQAIGKDFRFMCIEKGQVDQ